MGKVILIGAGCGEYDLLTLRAAKALEKCDCAVYDSLIDRRVLDFLPDRAERICVGKRAGKHSETQENINRIIVEKAREGKNVARIKGGDPFVFGRGGEEILSLKESGVPYSVVPGITSAVAVPELAGIPVTHRKVSRSFHVITGHTADDLLPENLKLYALLGGTLVFLMGLRNLRQIACSLTEGGMNPETPVAVISKGATAAEKTVRATLLDIADEVQKACLDAPAVIVVGDTAAYDFSSTVEMPLRGVTVGVTGTKRFAAKLSDNLRLLGANVKTADFLSVKPAKLLKPDFEKYSWAVFTSINGAEIFFEKLKEWKTDIRSVSHLKFAVIGGGTAKVLKQRGIYPDLVPQVFTSSRLGKALVQRVGENERVMIFRAQNGSAELTEILSDNGIEYDDIKAYTVADSGESFEDFDGCDFVTFASASGVRAFFDRGMRLDKNVRAVAIGGITAKALKACGVNDFTVASTQDSQGIAEIILREAKK